MNSKRKQAEYYNKTAKDLGTLAEGDIVRIKPVKLGQKEWDRGVVTKQVNQRSYEVETPKGICRRNRVHLNKSKGIPPTLDESITCDSIKSPNVHRENMGEDRSRSPYVRDKNMSTTVESEKNNSDDCGQLINTRDETTEKGSSVDANISEEIVKIRPVDNTGTPVRRSTRNRRLPGHLKDFKLC